MAIAMATAGHGTQGVEVVATDLGAVVRDAQETIQSHHRLLQQWGVNVAVSPLVKPEHEPAAESELEQVEMLPASKRPKYTVRCVEWDWSMPSPFHTQGNVDYVLAADVLYDDASIPAFLETLRSVVKESSVALIAYQHRHAAKEGRAWDQLREWGYEVRTCSPFARLEHRLGKTLTASNGGSTLEGLSDEQRRYMRLVEVRMISAPNSDPPVPSTEAEQASNSDLLAPSAEAEQADPAPDCVGMYL
jgi:hypothetical protein